MRTINLVPRCAGHGISRFAPAFLLLSWLIFLPTVHAQDAGRLDAAIERYVDRQRGRLTHEAREAADRMPASNYLGMTRTRGSGAYGVTRARPEDGNLLGQFDAFPGVLGSPGTAAFDEPIRACSFPALMRQDEPASQPAEEPAGKPAPVTDTADSLAEINNKLNNPGADLASLNFKLSWNRFTGKLPKSSSQDSLEMNFQPVFPFKLNDQGSNFLMRPSIPLVWRPHFNAGAGSFDESFGLGDMQLVMFYAETNKKTGFFWGAGPTMQFPTHTDDVLGNDAFMMGPAAYAGITGKWGILGVFPQHWWNIGGGDGYTALTAIQSFYWFNVGGGYQIGGSPIITYNWAEHDSSEAWTVPINLGVAKTVMIGDTPVKFKFEAMYYVEQPDAFGPLWGLQLTVTPVIPNPFEALLAKK